MGADVRQIANKRLVTCNEIYQGRSWKTYNALKELITEPRVKVEEKFEKAYSVANWMHLYACSNSRRAIRVQHSDRRWLYPEVTEDPWPTEKFDELYEWLEGPGLGIIMRWAQEFGDYVKPGEVAPMTMAKQEAIEESYSEAQFLAIRLCEEIENQTEPVALMTADVLDWAKLQCSGEVNDKPTEISGVMRSRGLLATKDRFRCKNGQGVSIQSRLLINEAAKKPLEEISKIKGRKTKEQKIAEILRRPSQILEPSMKDGPF